MAIPEIIELFDSGSGSLTRATDGTFSREVTIKWLLKGFTNYTAAEARVKATAPDVYAGHFRQRLDCQPLGNQWWLASATYASPSLEGDGDSSDGGGGGGEDLFPASVAFDTTGGTEHITQAYVPDDGSDLFGFAGEYRYAKEGLTAPDYKGAVNVSGDAVNGIDVVVPVFNFTETWTVPTTFLTNSYVSTLYQLTGRVNNSTFRVFQPGECLFMGARCEAVRGDFKAPITFSFAARPNQVNKKVGEITIANKKGWQYVWIEYENSVDNNNLIKRPKFAYVNDIYAEGDFAGLAIGAVFPSLYVPSANGPDVPNRG